MDKIPQLKLEFEQFDDNYTFQSKQTIFGNRYYYVIEAEGSYPIYFAPHDEGDVYNNCTSIVCAESEAEAIELCNIEYNKHCLNILIEYDKLGLLSQQASLALKPKEINWIENIPSEIEKRREPKLIGKTFFDIKFMIFDDGGTFDCWAIISDRYKPTSIELEYQYSLEEAKNHCLKFLLDNYLKDNNV